MCQLHVYKRSSSNVCNHQTGTWLFLVSRQKETTTMHVREIHVSATAGDETNLYYGCPPCGVVRGGRPSRKNSVPAAGMGSETKEQQS